MHGVQVRLASLPFGNRATMQREFKVDAQTRRDQINANGELVRIATITLDPRQSPDPRTFLSLLVHETNHARRWISHGDRRWGFPNRQTLPSLDEFVQMNRLNAAGDEALAHLRAAKFAERNSIPLSVTEEPVLEIARRRNRLSQTIRDLREFMSEKPEYLYQHGQLLKFIYQEVQQDYERRRRSARPMYSTFTSAELMSFSRLRKMGIEPPARGRQAVGRSPRWFGLRRWWAMLTYS